MSDPNEIDRWKSEVWDTLPREEQQRIIDARKQYLRRKRHDEYIAYLNTPQWQLLRRLKIEEAKGRCEVCMGKENLQVHHRTYERLFRESLSDLTVLCDACHELYHANDKVRKITA